MFRENASVALVTAGICYASISTLHAQSVTLYGIVDTGVEYINHANAAGRSIVRMPPLTGEIPSRWGIKGNEPLGAGTLRSSHSRAALRQALARQIKGGVFLEDRRGSASTARTEPLPLDGSTRCSCGPR
jgi:hypothetical protein